MAAGTVVWVVAVGVVGLRWSGGSTRGVAVGVWCGTRQWCASGWVLRISSACLGAVPSLSEGGVDGGEVTGGRVYGEDVQRSLVQVQAILD